MARLFNPFNPQGLVAPGMFCGREEEMAAVDNCIFQAKNGNPQHFLIQGERGIGKSSLLYFIESLASPREAKEAVAYNFLTVSLDLGGCASQLDILRAAGAEFKEALASRESIRKGAGEFWDWLTNWEILGVRFHKHPEEYDAHEAASQLVTNLAKLCSAGKAPLDGVLFLVDEADAPPTSANLGLLLKFVTERLSKRQCNNVIFGLAGQPTVLAKLRESHESAPRVFRTLNIRRLDPIHRKEVVLAGLDIAKQRNKVEVVIEPDALELIANLSEGYPHFIQQFAFSAFDADRDNKIDKDDVIDGAKDALKQLGDKYFSEMYHARVASADYRRVLDAMAKHGDEWMQRQDIIRESGVKQAIVDNALRALKQKGVIVPDDTRQGVYKLPTLSFAAWINAINAAGSNLTSSDADLFGGGG
jgi:hypothetical protein